MLWARTVAWGGRQLPGSQGLGGAGQGTAVQRPGGPHTASGGTGTHPEPPSQPPSSRTGHHPLFGAGGTAGIHRGQPGEPVAVHAVGQLPQPQRPLDQSGVGQAVAVLGGQALELGRQGRQPDRLAGRICVRVHGQNLSNPQLKASTNPKLGTTFSTEPGRQSVPAGSGATPVPGNYMGPDPRDHRARQLHGAPRVEVPLRRACGPRSPRAPSQAGAVGPPREPPTHRARYLHRARPPGPDLTGPATCTAPDATTCGQASPWAHWVATWPRLPPASGHPATS